MAVLGAIYESFLGHVATAIQWADAAGRVGRRSPSRWQPLRQLAGIPPGDALPAWPGPDAAPTPRALAPGLNPHSPLLGPALYFEAISHRLAGEAPEADALLANAVEINVRRRTYPSAIVALAERAAIAIERRDWASAQRFAQDAITIVDEGPFDGYIMAIAAYAVAARLAAHRGEMATAKDYTVLASRLRPLCSAACPESALSLLQLGHAYLECDDPTGARAVLRQVREIMQLRPDLGIVQTQADELSRMLDASPVGSVGVSSLTSAELRLLPLLATHLSYPEIGERLHVSKNTVKSEAASLFRKLAVSSRGGAVAPPRMSGSSAASRACRAGAVRFIPSG